MLAQESVLMDTVFCTLYDYHVRQRFFSQIDLACTPALDGLLLGPGVAVSCVGIAGYTINQVCATL